ncbi:hypothetical protein CVIRNUC_005922 [Coccomyxa viridis]|uniref:Uncharacterized protein n=1 Tax=Coccomyxa viridis TaxID=1274662 RepID=A0AAV1I934_9CHLO|nr:hypothetical protein CVIRNUC_005922 [Coccomyxa viridis]
MPTGVHQNVSVTGHKTFDDTPHSNGKAKHEALQDSKANNTGPGSADEVQWVASVSNSVPVGRNAAEGASLAEQCSANAHSAAQPSSQVHSTLGQWLRTCASATDLEVASVASLAPSETSIACLNPAPQGLKAIVQLPIEPAKSPCIKPRSTRSEDAVQWTPRSCRAHQASDDGVSPRACRTSVPAQTARLPKWARGLEALQSPHLQALAQQWREQQAHLSSVHLHPHEEEQDAELRYLEENSSAFEEQNTKPEADPLQEAESAEEGSPEKPCSSTEHSLLSQALRATDSTAHTAEGSMKAETQADDEDKSQTSTVAKLVRHWQHHPVSMPPVSKFRLGPVRDRLGACRSTASAYVDPVVMSKVQHYLNSSSAGPAPAGMPASAADRVVAPVDTAGSSSAAAHAQMSQHTPAQEPIVPAAGYAEDSLPGRAGLQTHGSTAAIRSDRSVGGASCWSTVTQAERTSWWGTSSGGFFSSNRNKRAPKS